VTPAVSRWLAVAGLAALAALLLWPPGFARLLSVAPLAGLMFAGLATKSRWAMATAILMLPYFSYGIMDMITNPAGRLRATVFAALTIAVFLVAMDSLRRGRP
jgi:uncharacterized membrane protein